MKTRLLAPALGLLATGALWAAHPAVDECTASFDRIEAAVAAATDPTAATALANEVTAAWNKLVAAVNADNAVAKDPGFRALQGRSSKLTSAAKNKANELKRSGAKPAAAAAAPAAAPAAAGPTQDLVKSRNEWTTLFNETGKWIPRSTPAQRRTPEWLKELDERWTRLEALAEATKGDAGTYATIQGAMTKLKVQVDAARAEAAANAGIDPAEIARIQKDFNDQLVDLGKWFNALSNADRQSPANAAEVQARVTKLKALVESMKHQPAIQQNMAANLAKFEGEIGGATARAGEALAVEAAEAEIKAFLAWVGSVPPDARLTEAFDKDGQAKLAALAPLVEATRSSANFHQAMVGRLRLATGKFEQAKRDAQYEKDAAAAKAAKEAAAAKAAAEAALRLQTPEDKKAFASLLHLWNQTSLFFEENLVRDPLILQNPAEKARAEDFLKRYDEYLARIQKQDALEVQEMRPQVEAVKKAYADALARTKDMVAQAGDVDGDLERLQKTFPKAGHMMLRAKSDCGAMSLEALQDYAQEAKGWISAGQTVRAWYDRIAPLSRRAQQEDVKSYVQWIETYPAAEVPGFVDSMISSCQERMRTLGALSSGLAAQMTNEEAARVSANLDLALENQKKAAFLEAEFKGGVSAETAGFPAKVEARRTELGQHAEAVFESIRITPSEEQDPELIKTATDLLKQELAGANEKGVTPWRRLVQGTRKRTVDKWVWDSGWIHLDYDEFRVNTVEKAEDGSWRVRQYSFRYTRNGHSTWPRNRWVLGWDGGWMERIKEENIDK